MHTHWRRVILTFLVPTLAFLLAGCGGEPDMKVLFIGNSYTHYNDMPEMVEDIASEAGVNIDVKMFAPGGHFLHEHAADPEVTDALSNGDYDVVVLQEQSEAPATMVFENGTIPAVQTLVGLARSSGTRVVLFETWGHRRGSAMTGHGDYDSMQVAISDAYAHLGALNGVPVAEVGAGWSFSIRAHPTIMLHDPDGSHPSREGSYLAALRIADVILDEPLKPGAVGGIDEDDEIKLFTTATK